ncbi:MAG: TetR/AcrR family transcriptional regulator [Candidatus Aminicenantes bacterium]|nr:TetR/AcrR family transcriptional regulator [Candidatus Aminicenantes bacterium]
MRFFDQLEKRKAEIVEAVLKLADRFGIKGITTKRIAEEVGVVEGSLYRHVRSKVEIFLMILDLADELLSRIFRELKGSPEEKLKGLLSYIGNFLQDFPGIYRIIFSDELYTERPDLFGRFRDFTLSLAKRIETIIKDGKNEGAFKPDLDLEIATFMYLGIVDTSFTLWNFIYDRNKDLREIMLKFFNMYLVSIKEGIS